MLAFVKNYVQHKFGLMPLLLFRLKKIEKKFTLTDSQTKVKTVKTFTIAIYFNT